MIKHLCFYVKLFCVSDLNISANVDSQILNLGLDGQLIIVDMLMYVAAVRRVTII